MKKTAIVLITLILLIPFCNGEYYKIANIKTSPDKIDRKTATITEVPVQIQLLLLPEQEYQKAKIISTQAECTSEDLSEYYLLRKTTQTPIITAKIMPDTEKNQTTIQCTLTITLLKNNQTIIEEKNIEKTIELYSSPMGEISQTIQDKIDQINEDIHAFEKKAAQIERVNRITGQIAAYAEQAAALDAIVSTTLGIIWPIAVVLEEIPTPYTKAAAKVLWQGAGWVLLRSHELLITQTWNPGYRPTGLSNIASTFIKALTIIQSCKACDYSNTYTALMEQSAGKKIFTIDDKQGKPTRLEQLTVYEWEPYKSIHVAQACMCLPAISYNLQKEKQIKCIYRNCIEQNAEYGLPLGECEKTLKQQQCLYVDGAAWKISGGNALAQIFSQITNAVLKHTPEIYQSFAWQNMCDYNTGALSQQAYPETLGKPDIVSDWAVPLCSVTAGIQILKETDYFKGNKYEWDQYMGKLEGEDYC